MTVKSRDQRRYKRISDETLTIIAAIGDLSTFDRLRLSVATLRSMRSHIRTLSRNEIELNRETLTSNTVALLDRLRDTKNRPLKDEYKRQIGISIKRIYPDATISLEKYNLSRKQKANVRVADANYVHAIQRISEQAVKEINAVRDAIIDLSMYDTAMACILTLATSMRISELHELRLSHLDQIEAGQRVGIRTKGHTESRAIPMTDVLRLAIGVIREHRALVVANVTNKVYSLRKAQQTRLDQDYILTTSVPHMTTTLRNLAAAAGVRINSLGFNAFRTLVTSVLTEGGGHFIAKSLNNHSSVNTTLDHYTVVSATAAEKAFDNVMQISSDLNKKTRLFESVDHPLEYVYQQTEYPNEFAGPSVNHPEAIITDETTDEVRLPSAVSESNNESFTRFDIPITLPAIVKPGPQQNVVPQQNMVPQQNVVPQQNMVPQQNVVPQQNMVPQHDSLRQLAQHQRAHHQQEYIRQQQRPAVQQNKTGHWFKIRRTQPIDDQQMSDPPILGQRVSDPLIIDQQMSDHPILGVSDPPIIDQQMSDQQELAKQQELVQQQERARHLEQKLRDQRLEIRKMLEQQAGYLHQQQQTSQILANQKAHIERDQEQRQHRQQQRQKQQNLVLQERIRQRALRRKDRAQQNRSSSRDREEQREIQQDQTTEPEPAQSHVITEQEQYQLHQEREQLRLNQEQDQLRLNQEQEQLRLNQEQEQLRLNQEQEQLRLNQEQEQLRLQAELRKQAQEHQLNQLESQRHNYEIKIQQLETQKHRLEDKYSIKTEHVDIPVSTKEGYESAVIKPEESYIKDEKKIFESFIKQEPLESNVELVDTPQQPPLIDVSWLRQIQQQLEDEQLDEQQPAQHRFDQA